MVAFEEVSLILSIAFSLDGQGSSAVSPPFLHAVYFGEAAGKQGIGELWRSHQYDNCALSLSKQEVKLPTGECRILSPRSDLKAKKPAKENAVQPQAVETSSDGAWRCGRHGIVFKYIVFRTVCDLPALLLTPFLPPSGKSSGPSLLFLHYLLESFLWLSRSP